MYDKNQIEDSLEFIRQMKDFYESNDFFADFDPMEGHGDDELFANLAENLEQKNRLMESVTQGVQTTGAFSASAEEEKRRQLEEQRIAEERRAAQEERRLLEEERKQLQREIRQRELQERQRALEEEQKRQAEIAAERKRIEKERQAALEEQRKQEEIRKQIEEERKRLAAEQKLAAERRAAEEKLAAERQAAEEERRRAEQERQTALEEQRKIEEERRRLAAEQKWAAEHKAAEEKLAAERKAAEEKLAAERRVAEEERRRMEAERRANEEKLAAERRAAEEKLAAERRAAEEERRRIEAERQRLAEERLQRELEEQKRLVAEQRRREEEEKRRREAEEKKRRQEMVLAEERRRKEIEEEERRKAAREQEERLAAEKKQQEAELAKQNAQNAQTGQAAIANGVAMANGAGAAITEKSATEKKEEVKPGTDTQEEAAVTATPIINIAAPNASTINTSAEKQSSTDTEVSRLQKRAEELQRQAEMATLEARMRQLQLEAQVAQGVYPTPQINIPAAGNTAANGAVPFAQVSIPGMANNAESADNSNQKSSKESVDDIFLRELEKFQGGDENSSGRMKNGHPLQKYINNFDGKTLSSLIPAEKIIDVGYKVKDVVDDQIWNIKHFIQKKIDNSGDIEAQQKTKKIISNLVVVAICVFFAYLIAMMITHFVAHPTKVEGESMETTLTNGDTVVIQKMSYYLGHPERYDVVVFPVPNYNSKTYYIKRVIGLPGETVQIKDGKVYIDEKELDSDKYGKDDYINDPGDVAEPITLAKNEYFVLGDNRNMSTDSRSSYVGMVNERYIIGKAWERIWPLSKIGSIGK